MDVDIIIWYAVGSCHEGISTSLMVWYKWGISKYIDLDEVLTSKTSVSTLTMV